MQNNKKIKEEKRKDWQDFVETQMTLQTEKLSKVEQWILENEGKNNNVYYDMKAVLK